MLAAPPLFFTFNGYGLNPAPLDTSEIPTTAYGRTHHQHSTPVFYKSQRFGRDGIHRWRELPRTRLPADRAGGGELTVTYLGAGDVIPSEEVPDPGGMPGTMMTLSANGMVEDTAVLWCLSPYGDANKTITPGRLTAYGAGLDRPGGQLVKIWDSADWGITFMHCKFNILTPANGKLYVPTYDGRVMVWGLAPT